MKPNPLLNPFPALPADTARAAEAAFGEKNEYLTIGDSLDRLFADADFRSLYPEDHIPCNLPAMLSLVAVFQYFEGLTDRRAAEASRVRVDWKYALHLSLGHPGLRADSLCDFRRRVRSDRAGKEQLQQLLDRLYELSPRSQKGFPHVTADTLLEAVCTRCRLELMATAMNDAVQTLAASHNDYLRSIVRPHWYFRYGRDVSALRVPDSVLGQIDLAESMCRDAIYLLETIEGTNADLASIEEVRRLKYIVNTLFQRFGSECKWSSVDCPGGFPCSDFARH